MTLGITTGLEVLDLGCGDGTTAVPAARLGANVLGVDIASNLVEAGNARAQSLGLTNCRFQEGDASDLNELEDDSFDLVVSIFGAMFAPRPFDVAKEMVRVTRPGGRIVMGNWIPNDPTLVAQILKISAVLLAAAPGRIRQPMTWGVEENVIERFAGAGVPERADLVREGHVHVQFPRRAIGASCSVQDVLRTDDERVRSCSRERPRGRSAGRVGSPLQRARTRAGARMPPRFPQRSCA